MNSKYEILSPENDLMVRMLKKGILFRFPQLKNKYVFFLREGFLKIAVANPGGREVIKYLVKAGDFFGELPLLHAAESGEDYAVALEDSVVSFVEVEKLWQWMQTHPPLRADLGRQVGLRIRKAEGRLLSMVLKDASTRVREFLSSFVWEYGRRTGEGYEIKNCLTHDDIAKLTDTSRQTVSSVLNELRDQKLIEYNNEWVRIPADSPLYREDQRYCS